MRVFSASFRKSWYNFMLQHIQLRKESMQKIWNRSWKHWKLCLNPLPSSRSNSATESLASCTIPKRTTRRVNWVQPIHQWPSARDSREKDFRKLHTVTRTSWSRYNLTNWEKAAWVGSAWNPRQGTWLHYKQFHAMFWLLVCTAWSNQVPQGYVYSLFRLDAEETKVGTA